MVDERLRALERRWQETGAPEDEAAFLVAKSRIGQGIEHLISADHNNEARRLILQEHDLFNSTGYVVKKYDKDIRGSKLLVFETASESFEIDPNMLLEPSYIHKASWQMGFTGFRLFLYYNLHQTHVFTTANPMFTNPDQLVGSEMIAIGQEGVEEIGLPTSDIPAELVMLTTPQRSLPVFRQNNSSLIVDINEDLVWDEPAYRTQGGWDQEYRPYCFLEDRVLVAAGFEPYDPTMSGYEQPYDDRLAAPVAMGVYDIEEDVSVYVQSDGKVFFWNESRFLPEEKHFVGNYQSQMARGFAENRVAACALPHMGFSIPQSSKLRKFMAGETIRSYGPIYDQAFCGDEGPFDVCVAEVTQNVIEGLKKIYHQQQEQQQ